MTEACHLCVILIAIAALGIPGPGLVLSILPQASQEGLLRPYKSYADVTLFHYSLPREVSRATWEFAAFMDSSECPTRQVYIYLQHGSYPVMNPDNSTFPHFLYTEGRSLLHTLSLRAAYQPHDASVLAVSSPLPGDWFAAAFMPHWEQAVVQEGLRHKCHYSLGSIALWNTVSNVLTLHYGGPHTLRTLESLSYYKFYVPRGTWYLSVTLSTCRFLTTPRQEFTNHTDPIPCLQNVAVSGRSMPSINTNGSNGNLYPGKEVVISVERPYTDNYYYLFITSEAFIEFNATLLLHECPLEMVGRSVPRHMWTQVAHTLSRLSWLHHNGSNSSGGNVTTVLESDVEEDISYHPVLRTPTSLKCLPMFQLSRIHHAQDFSNSYLLQGKEWYSTWVALTPVTNLVLRFDILPFLDIGGTLRVGLRMDDTVNRNSSVHEVIWIEGCVNQGIVVDPSDCPPGLVLRLSFPPTGEPQQLLVPFPQPDMWFLTLNMHCTHPNTSDVIDCSMESSEGVAVGLEIGIQPCVLGGSQPCGEWGTCQETHKGQFFYTSCICSHGYRGWACSDSSLAPANSTLLLTTILLTLSNICFLPAVIVAIRRGLYPEAVVYASTMFFSCLYHACDQQEAYGICLAKYEVLQFCDFFCSILAFWVTLVAMATLPPAVASSLHMIGVLMVAMGVQANRTGLSGFIIPFGLGLCVPVITWSVRCCIRRECLHIQLRRLVSVFTGVGLAGIGLGLFALVETEDNYQYVHSVWHMSMALSLVFLLPFPTEGKQRVTPYEYMMDDHNNDSELMLDASERTLSSPVFFLTSDLDAVEDVPTIANGYSSNYLS